MEYLTSNMRHCTATALALILLACHTMARPPYNMSPVIFTDYSASYPGQFYHAGPRMDYGPVLNGYQFSQTSYPQFGVSSRSYGIMSPGPQQLYMPSSRSGYWSSRSNTGRSGAVLRSSRPLYPSSRSFISHGISPFRRYNNSPRKRFGSAFKKTVLTKTSMVLPRVIRKINPLKKKHMPDVLTDSLANIMPHPSPIIQHHLMKKRRRRFHMVAKAKSFPGILKGTALGINKI